MKKSKILIVVDVQRDFINGSLSNVEAQKAVPNIVKKINDFDGDYILITRDTHNEDYLETNEGKCLPVKHCIKNTVGWGEDSRIANVLMDKDIKEKHIIQYFEKPTFGSEKLMQYVKNIKGELDIEIIGFVSSICVITNALLIKTAVYDRANITVDASCTAGLTYDNNLAALEVLKSCQINVINA